MEKTLEDCKREEQAALRALESRRSMLGLTSEMYSQAVLDTKWYYAALISGLQ